MSRNRHRASVSTVALFSKPHPEATAVLRRVAASVQRRGLRLVTDVETAKALGREDGLPRAEAARRADLLISVGGDGTLLAAARAVSGAGTPILGVNLGSLGFLTETPCDELDQVLEAAIEGTAPVEIRHALQVRRDGEPTKPENTALNDVVFSKRDLARLFTLSVFVDDGWVADYRADGLILATPTGSTAYNLAAGGPVVVPRVDALVATPICPHSLSQRPLILPGSARVTVTLAEGQGAADVQVTLDGQVGFPLEPGERILVQRSPNPVRLIRPPGRSFFSVLRDKLGWGRH
ncbi:MAG: NAD(+) kinase [Acidobacteria bacterium]|nr:MAG: NAD(+) kinase [Acidobacteriota bacterium]